MALAEGGGADEKFDDERFADLKILIYNLTTTTKTGGVESFTVGIAKALAKRGHSVDIFGGRGDIKIEEMPGLAVFTFPFLDRSKIPNFGSRFRKFMERLTFALFTFKRIIRGGYDAIYIHKPYDLPAALLASRLTGIKVVFSTHGTEFFPFYGVMARRVDRFFACSRYIAGEVEKYCRLKPEVIYNGVDTTFFCKRPPDEALKKRLGIGNEIVLVSVCRLIGLKGIQYALQAIYELKHTNVQSAGVQSAGVQCTDVQRTDVRYAGSIRYVIVGDGPYLPDLRKLAGELGLSELVIFTGSLPNDEVAAYYNLAEIALFPSIADEAFGISIAEAMASGLSVVATGVGGIPEVLSNATGLLVPPKDDESLAKAIRYLIATPRLRKELGDKARARARENFDWNSIAERFEKSLNLAGNSTIVQ
ncbi:MAG: glycosyltransferase family 4 protein [Nitrospirae bacterium]|nr:glycosyltransferase family 4 protein [Nitrospirota bacterium]